MLDDAIPPSAKNDTERLFAEAHGSDTIAVFYHFATFSELGGLLNKTKLQLLETILTIRNQGELSRLRHLIAYSVEGKTSEARNSKITSPKDEPAIHVNIGEPITSLKTANSLASVCHRYTQLF